MVISIVAVSVGAVAAGANASVVDFAVARWSDGAGADGRTYALVMVDEPWSWREARAMANEMGAELAAAPTPQALSFIIALASRPGAFDCAGPWIGGSRFGGGSWSWVDGATFSSFAWAPGRPAQSSLLDAAICLGGSDSPDGTWIDALPGPDAGAQTRSAIFVWNAFEDCDNDGIPDRLDDCSTIVGDINRDGRVNGADLGLMMGAFNGTEAAFDLNHDGIVNGADLGLLLSNWTGS
jgi:hypothetical protein